MVTGEVSKNLGLVVPLFFGVTLLVLWEVLVRGLNVPDVLLPPPSRSLD